MISFMIYFCFYTVILMIITYFTNKILIRYLSQLKRYKYIFFAIKTNVLVYMLMPILAYLSSSYKKIFVNKMMEYIVKISIILYLIGFVYIGIDILRLYKKEQEVSKLCIPCEDSFVIRTFERMKESEHMKRCRIELCQNERVIIPQARGVLFPKIVLPYGRSYSYVNRDLEIILIHELNHHRNKDLVYRYLCHLIIIIYWFLPTAYLLMEQFIFWAEIRVDFATCENIHLQLDEGEYVLFLYNLIIKNNPRVRLRKVYESLDLVERMQIIANRNKSEVKSIK